MAFSIDYSQTGQELLPEGEYECVIDRVMEASTKNGTDYIDVKLDIREDVKNPGGGILYESIWKAKNPTKNDRGCGGYQAWKIQQLSKAAGLQNGKSYQNLGEWGEDLLGRAVRAIVYHDTYRGKKIARISEFSPSKAPAPAPTPAQEWGEVNDDEEAPF